MAEEVINIAKIPSKYEIICKPESYFVKRYPEFHNEINRKYPDDISFYEKLYWNIHNITTYPLCPICGDNRLHFHSRTKGYYANCSIKCSRNNPDVNKKREDTNLKRYGAKNPFGGKTIQEKIRNTNLKKYGVEYPMQNASIQLKSEDTFMGKYGVRHYLESEEGKNKIISKMDESIKKRDATNINRYGTTVPMRLDSIKDKKNSTCKDRYGVDHYTMTDEYKDRAYQSKKEHGTFNSSSIEDDFARWLDDNDINYVRQYRSEKYPFNCDFYFPDEDMYFEINGTWTHGFHPYDPDSPEDQETLDIWKLKDTNYYDIAITVWTKSDPEKSEIAKRNGLNWKCIYSIDLDEIIRYFEENYKI